MKIRMEASEVVLDGFTIQTDAETLRFSDRYVDDRGVELRKAVTGVLGDFTSIAAIHDMDFWHVSPRTVRCITAM